MRKGREYGTGMRLYGEGVEKERQHETCREREIIWRGGRGRFNGRLREEGKGH